MAKEWIVPDAEGWCGMRLLDADALIKYANNSTVGIDANDIARFPRVDAVPVVRCRECVHWATGTNEEESWEYCTLLDHEIDGDRFCAYGERKDGDA